MSFEDPRHIRAAEIDALQRMLRACPDAMTDAAAGEVKRRSEWLAKTGNYRYPVVVALEQVTDELRPS